MYTVSVPQGQLTAVPTPRANNDQINCVFWGRVVVFSMIYLFLRVKDSKHTFYNSVKESKQARAELFYAL